MSIAKISQKINEYTLLEMLGEGAYAKVFLAEGPLGTKYALKMIRVNPTNKEKIREQGVFLALMKHKNLIWAREFFFFDKEQFFVIITELCEGGSLDKIIGDSYQNVSQIMEGIAEGLRFLHLQKNIMHRDLKPENILLHGNIPKIGDLGVSRVLENQLTSTVVGTQFYMAPEIVKGEYSFKVDIWALGIIFLQLLTGKRIWVLTRNKAPFRLPNFPQQNVLQQIHDEKYREMVSRMLIKNEFKRANIEEVCSYFPEMTPLKYSNKNLNGLNKAPEIVKEVYQKFTQYIANKHSKNFMVQLIEQNTAEIKEEEMRNNKKAQFLLGKKYQQDFGKNSNPAKAFQEFIKAYQQEEPYSCYELYLMSDNDREKNQFLETGRIRSELRCELEIAECHMKGTCGFAKDLGEAEDIVYDLCERGFPQAYLLKGRLQAKENNPMPAVKIEQPEILSIQKKISLVERNYKAKKYEEAISVELSLEKMSLQDKLKILEILAKCNIKLKNEEKAIEYYNKCIKLDPGDIQKDYKGQVAYLYEKLEKLSNAIEYYYDAIYALIPKREKSAFFEERLQDLCERLYILLVETKRYDDAFILAQLSASLGFHSGAANYAYMLFMGQGVDQNVKAGIEMLQNQKKKGNKQAEEYLKDIKTLSEKQ